MQSVRSDKAMATTAEPGHEPQIIGESSALREVMRQAATVAGTDSTVLIQGETGTGKELIAQAIHRDSGKAGRLVKLNAAAVPSTLLESELFGHERGAFTGAFARRVGRCELADRGTLFLDEIGELPLELQPKLLRFLQEREFERVGGMQTLKSSARLVVATHRDLLAMVRAGDFREDLYYRLNVFPLRLPPLRERREDIPLLVRAFVDSYCRKTAAPVPALTPDVLARLSDYGWPGNVRQLQNVIERALILSKGEARLKLDLPAAETALPLAAEAEHSLDAVQRAHIINVLESTGWVIGGPKGAAVKLGMKRTTLNFRLKKLGIAQQTRKDRWLCRNV